jgi:hypothetical protein
MTTVSSLPWDKPLKKGNLDAIGDPRAIQAIQRYSAGAIGRDQFLAAL